MLDVHKVIAILSCQLQKKTLLLSEIQPLIDGCLGKLKFLVTNESLRATRLRIILKEDEPEVESKNDQITTVTRSAYFGSKKTEVLQR